MKYFEILGITDRGNQWGLKTKEYTISDTPNFADLNRRGAIGSNGFWFQHMPDYSYANYDLICLIRTLA